MLSAEMHRGRQMKSNHRFSRICALLLLPLLSLWAAPCEAAGASGPHGSVDLVSEQTSVQTARSFWVGLRFQLEQGWHIYWTNPGDSGEPPRVKWDLPAGFQAGPLHWPIPRRIEDHSLIDYGYQGEVLLPVEITPPTKLAAGANVLLNATVNWLVCRELCVPGRATLALTLPAGNATPGPASPMHSLFAKARADLPRPTPKVWKATANLDKHLFILNVETGRQETRATFFPLEPNQIENAAPQKVSPSSRGVRLEMEKSDQLLKVPPRLTGVLLFPSGQGYVIEAPVITTK
jgi:thiol:disulfide interchange protein DsbD